METNKKNKLALYSLMLKGFNRNRNKLKNLKRYSQFVYYKRKLLKMFQKELSHFYDYPIEHNRKTVEYLDYIKMLFNRAETKQNWIECIKHFK